MFLQKIISKGTQKPIHKVSLKPTKPLAKNSMLLQNSVYITYITYYTYLHYSTYASTQSHTPYFSLGQRLNEYLTVVKDTALA